MQLNEKGYYFTVLMFGLFASISVQKAVRDQMEGIPVTDLYYGIAWFSTILSMYCSPSAYGIPALKKVKKAFTPCRLYLVFFLPFGTKKYQGYEGFQNHGAILIFT
jgi:uncharacterized membrane protein YiaA